MNTEQILKDNPHFEGDIRFIKCEHAQGEDYANFGYTLYLEVGCTGNHYRAGYNWHPGRLQWELGCN